MSQDQEYVILANRVAALEQRVAEMAGYLRSALGYLSTDPQSSLTKSRVTLEKLLIILFRQTMQSEPRRPMIGDMLADKGFVAMIPRRIIARMNAVREMSNLGPHGGDVDLTDAVRVMRDLLDVLEWYAINYDPSTGAVGAQEPRDSVEILPRLKEKYPTYLRPGITSVKFAQSKDRCYLETTTADLIASYLHNETTRREDLAFIGSGSSSDELLFDPMRSVVENAHKFVSEMDEISIINCTDLFPPDIAAKIDEVFRANERLPK
ncbi:MAG: hypothetical protein AABN33_06015 [Acidobacteriota bacterium]